MSASEKFCVVVDEMTITKRDLIIVTSPWEGGVLTVSDWIELRSADGTRNRAQVKSFELVRFSSEKQAQRSVSGSDSFALLLSHIDRSLIHIGNEVWSVADTGRYLNL